MLGQGQDYREMTTLDERGPWNLSPLFDGVLK